MKPGLRVGDVAEVSVQVQDEMKACFDGVEVHPLYSTAAMINHMEWAARHHILPYLETGEEGVGYEVNVKHLRPTPIGATVQIRSTVSVITEHRITSQVEAWNETDKIGEGTIVQALIAVEKLEAAITKAGISNTAKAFKDQHSTSSDPSPAILEAEDGQSFSLDILRWETGMLPCSRYDEWLICAITVQNATQQPPLPVEGPFLLRHEIEEWAMGIQALLDGQQDIFQSDFLESAIRIRMQKQGNGIRTSFCLLASSSATTAADTEPATTSLDMTVRQTALTAFVTQLMTQLDGFPSRL